MDIGIVPRSETTGDPGRVEIPLNKGMSEGQGIKTKFK